MSVAEKQLETARLFVDGYNAWNIEAVLRPRADDCVHATLPVSLHRPPRTNADYKIFFGNLQEQMKNFKMTIHKIINDPEQHSAVIHASASAETAVGPYKNEYAMFLLFNESGDKVIRVEEFVDSQFSTEFFVKLQEHVDQKPYLE